jgi:hypothetical protein
MYHKRVLRVRQPDSSYSFAAIRAFVAMIALIWLVHLPSSCVPL